MASVWHEDGRQAPFEEVELRRVATSMLIARRALHGALPAALIHDAALECLLVLYLSPNFEAPFAKLELEVASAPILVRRWLAAVAAEGLVEIGNGHAALSPEGQDRMRAVITKVIRSQRELNGWGDQ